MKFLNDRIKHTIRSAKDFCVYRVLHADDPPHRLALGIAVGFFVTFTPLMGIQMVLSVFIAWLLKANKLVGIPIVWISNPVTFIPIYYPCYWVGCKLLGMPPIFEDLKSMVTEWQMLAADPAAGWGARIRFWWDSLMTVVEPLGIGCLLVATVAGVVSYYLSLYAIRSYRLRRWGQLMPPKLTPAETIDDTQVAGRPSAGGGNAA